MSDITRKKLRLKHGANEFEFEPEVFTDFPQPICEYTRAVDTSLQTTHFATKRRIHVADWMLHSTFEDLVAIISTVEAIEYCKLVLPHGGSWVAAATINVKVIHPIDLTDTDTLYRFSFNMEEV